MINVYKVTPPSTITYSWGEAQDAFLTGQASQIVLGSAAIYNFVMVMQIWIGAHA